MKWGWWGHWGADEAIEATEAVEVIEAAGVADAREITQYVKCMLFLIFRGQIAIEVIETSDAIMSVEATEVF